MTTGLVWLNIPLCAIAFIAAVGIPLRLVLTHPGQEHGHRGTAPRPA
jgi:hypothetical protein